MRRARSSTTTFLPAVNGHPMMAESKTRKRQRRPPWRVFAAVNTMVVSGFLTKSAGIGSKIASFDAIVKTSLMVMYDQLWNRVDWGKELENLAGDGI